MTTEEPYTFAQEAALTSKSPVWRSAPLGPVSLSSISSPYGFSPILLHSQYWPQAGAMHLGKGGPIAVTRSHCQPV